MAIIPFGKCGIQANHRSTIPCCPGSKRSIRPGRTKCSLAAASWSRGHFLTRIPDDDIIVTDRVATAVPGAGATAFVGTRDDSGSYAMVYAPIGRPFQVRMDKISGPKVNAWWFNPRDGTPD